MMDTNTSSSAMDSLKNNASAAYDNITKGPVAQSVMDEHAKTSAELSKLAASRQTPSQPAATGQPLTHYHSFFSELLSWKNPRASGIAYLSIVSFILAVRYLDLLRYGFKLTWMVLGLTVGAEVVGKAVLNSGLATQLRPRRYYTVPRETLDAMIGDMHELVNFFVIEFQRILFAENVPASILACIGAFTSYYLVAVMPYWGLALLATTLLFAVPLVYTTNQELIDTQIQHANEILAAQTAQLRELTAKQTEQMTVVVKQYAGDYTAQAQALFQKGKESISGGAAPAAPAAPKPAAESNLRDSDFPAAPREEFRSEVKHEEVKHERAEEEPLLAL